jgi:hypothetical protein
MLLKNNTIKIKVNFFAILLKSKPFTQRAFSK